MAKHKDHESKDPAGHDDPEQTHAARAAAHAPPSPSDSAGEKTDNVAPANKLPHEGADEDGADEVAVLKAERAALAKAVTGLGLNAAEICKQATVGLTPKKAKKAGPVKTATVNGVDVEYPADAADKDGAAVEAYKAKAGVWHLPAPPTVEHHK